jgi:TonB-linked SusC/RagA family outer membrane protein
MKYSYKILLGISNLKNYLLGMILTVVAISAYAQDRTVSGTITDAETGETLPGATVMVKGTDNGTITDIDGGYQLVIGDDATLVVSFVGYVTAESAVGAKNKVDVALELDLTSLEEVVVIGYGAQRKVDLTGSVAIVDSKEMKKISNSNMSTMLQGKVAGVQITSDGQPGADPVVRVRGMGSFGDTSPLYIVDGVIIGTTVRDFSPNDIESIQILKDASAAAIYGSRAANGVVIITTKSGQKNQSMKIDYSGYVGFDKVQDGIYDVMDASQYADYVTMAYSNNGLAVPSGYDPTSANYLDPNVIDTDWKEEAFKTGVRQNHNINFSGGGANNTYNVAIDYFSQKGTIEGAGPNFDRYTARFKNTMDYKFLKFNTNIVYSHSDQDNMALSNANEFVQGLYGQQFPVMASVLLTPPSIKAYDESTWVLDGIISPASEYTYDSYGYGTYYDDVHGDIRVTNVLLTNNLIERNTKVDRVVASGSTNVDFMEMLGMANGKHKLNYNLNLSYSKTFAKDFTFIPAFIQSTTNYLNKENEVLTQGYRNYTATLLENTLTYDGNIGLHHINAVGGYTFQTERVHTLTGIGYVLPEPYYLQVNNADDESAASYESEANIESYFGRLIYDFDEKYLFTATVRRDASSRLSPANNSGIFPSVSAGWRLDKESFFPVSKSIVNLMKFRGSYGELGNTTLLGPYDYMSTMSRNNYTYSFGNSKVLGSTLTDFVNTAIRWERKKTLDLGIDLALFESQVELTVDYYKATSEDLHYDVPIPTQGGFRNTSEEMNAATMVNSGFEFLLAYHNDKNAVKFDVSANLTTLKNEVLALDILDQPFTTGDYRTEVGNEVGMFYGYVYEGIFQSQDEIDNRINDEGELVTQAGAQPGDVAYKDINNDGTINSSDRTYLGSGLPDITFGFNIRAEWKGLDLNIFTFGAAGFKAVDFVDMALHSSYRTNNKSVDLLNAWTPENTDTDVPRVAYTPAIDAVVTNDFFSSRFIQNANYLKIASIQIGYNFPDKVFNDYIKNLRVYTTIQNLARITKYNGYNPDFAGGTFTPGYNYASYPTPRTIMFGAQFSF